MEGIYPSEDAAPRNQDPGVYTFLASVRTFAGNVQPDGTAFAAGQSLQIAQNTALFSLLGVTYGGDAVRTFSLPDLRGRLMVGEGDHTSLGEIFGTESFTVGTGNM